MRFIGHKTIHFFALVSATVLVANAPGADTVPWAPDLVTAQQTAAQTGKLLMIHFTADSCAPCRRLEKKVFNRPIFGYTLGQQVVPVKVNATSSPDVARQFNVNSWPTDILMTAQGQEVHRMISPQDSDKYLRTIGQFAWRYRQQSGGAGGTMSAPGTAQTPRGTSSRNNDTPLGERQSVFGDTYQKSPYGATGLGRRGANRQTQVSPARVPASGNAQAAYNAPGTAFSAAAAPYAATAQQSSNAIATVSNQVAAGAANGLPQLGPSAAVQNPYAAMTELMQQRANQQSQKPLASAANKAKGLFSAATRKLTGSISAATGRGRATPQPNPTMNSMANPQPPMAAARPITDGVGLTPGYATNSSFAQAASVHMGQMQNQANAASRQIAGQVQQAAGQVQQAAVQTQQQVAGAASQVGSDFMKQMAAFNQAAKVKLQNTVTADQKLAINPALAAPTTPTPPTSNQGPTVNYGRPATGAGASIIPARPMAPTADTLRGGLQPTQAMMAEAAAAVPSTDIYSPAVVVNSTIPQASPKVVSKPQPVAAPPAAIQATPSRPQPTLQASIPTANGSSTNQLATASVPTARLQSVPTQSGEPAVDGRARTIPAQVQSSVASKPANTSGFALSGYDCVALMDGNEWVKGDARWGARHRGQVFLFQTAAAQQSFLANPEGYSPVLAGYDPVIFHETGEYEMGSRAHGVRYKDKMFLFTSEASLQRFWKAPWQYSQSAEVASRVSR